MAGLSDTHEQALLEWLTKTTTFPAAVSALWVSLHSTDPGDTGTGELSTGTGSYGRAQHDPDPNNSTDAAWNAVDTSGTAKRVTNKTAITFPQASADWNGGAAIKWFGLWSAQTTGTFYVGGTVNGSTGVIILSGNTFSFTGGTPGQLSITID